MRRIVRLIGILVLAAASASSVFVGGLVAQHAPSDTLAVPGLAQPVDVVRDRWGINHIYARGETDLFTAQGYLAARDQACRVGTWSKGAAAGISGSRRRLSPNSLRIFPK
jgi:penicillin amidase